MKEKTFYKILVEFNSSVETTKRRLSDKRLTKTEKLIIQGHLQIRRNQNQDVIETFKNISPSDMPFVEAQRLLLIGAAYNNLTLYREAEKWLLKSLEILVTLDVPYFIFYANHSLFSIYDNLNDTKSMHKILTSLKKIHKTQRQEVLVTICEFCYEQLKENYSKVRELSEEIDRSIVHLNEMDTTRHLVNKFMFFAQIEDLDSVREVLGELKKCRNYVMSESYNFMKKLVDHITHDAPLYVYENQFTDAPLLFHQLKVIQCLEEKKMDVAAHHWGILKEMVPLAYGDNFEFKSPACIFSIALKKQLRAKKTEQIEIKNISGDKLIDRLIFILSNSTTPVAASDLFEKIWGREAESKDDIKKLSRLIYRAKLRNGLEVEFRKGTYSLKFSSSKSKTA